MILSFRAVRRAFWHAFSSASLFALAMLCSACAEVTIYPTLASRAEFDNSTAPGIVERGLGFPVVLVADGYRGEKLVVRTFDSARVFLGDTSVVPQWEVTRWDPLYLFVPYSKLFTSADRIDHVVLKPGHDDVYISRWDRREDPWKSEHTPPIVWAVRHVDLDAYLGRGRGFGVKIRADLFIRGMVGKTPEILVVCVDAQGKNVVGVPGPRLGPVPHSPAVYRDLVLEIPYSLLAALPPTERLDASPRVRVDDEWQPPNVWIAMHAGGAINSQLDNVGIQIDALDAIIPGFERLLQLLEALK